MNKQNKNRLFWINYDKECLNVGIREEKKRLKAVKRVLRF